MAGSQAGRTTKLGRTMRSPMEFIMVMCPGREYKRQNLPLLGTASCSDRLSGGTQTLQPAGTLTV